MNPSGLNIAKENGMQPKKITYLKLLWINFETAIYIKTKIVIDIKRYDIGDDIEPKIMLRIYLIGY